MPSAPGPWKLTRLAKPARCQHASKHSRVRIERPQREQGALRAAAADQPSRLGGANGTIADRRTPSRKAPKTQWPLYRRPHPRTSGKPSALMMLRGTYSNEQTAVSSCRLCSRAVHRDRCRRASGVGRGLPTRALRRHIVQAGRWQRHGMRRLDGVPPLARRVPTATDVAAVKAKL